MLPQKARGGGNSPPGPLSFGITAIVCTTTAVHHAACTQFKFKYKFIIEEDVDGESDIGNNSDFLPAAAASDMKLNQARQWQRYAFMKPLQLLSELSGFPNLYILYSIFACLAVSSASAERALSKLRIIKNRLRSSMSDDYLSALMIIASEKDLLVQLKDDDIISRVACARPTLRAQLLH